MEKYIKFLKGPYCKFKTQIQWKFCEKPGERTFFKLKKKFQVSIKEKKNNGFYNLKKN